MSPFFSNLDFIIFAGGSVALMVALARQLRRRAVRVPLFVWVVPVLILFGCWLVLLQVPEHERGRLQSMVAGILPTYAEELERMGHRNLTPATKPDDAAYLTMIEAEKRWLRANHTVNDIYTLRRLPDGRIALIVDSETDYNGDGKYEGEREQRTRIGEPYGGALVPSIEKALSGEPAFMEEVYTDRWGTWVSALQPMYGPDGKVEAALGVDFDAQVWLQAIGEARRLWIFVFAGFMALVLAPALAICLQKAEIGRRRQTEVELRRSEQKLSLRAAQTPVALVEWGLDASIQDWNRAAERLFGRRREAVIGCKLLDEIAPENVRTEIRAILGGNLVAGAGALFGKRIMHRTDTLTCEWINAPLLDAEGQLIGVTSLCEDVGERCRLEEQLRQAQKMEAIGQLAGGIAHDFRNVMTVVQGYGELLQTNPEATPSILADLDELLSASERATALTEKLLALSRRQAFRPESQDLNEIAGAMARMMERLLGTKFAIGVKLTPKVPKIIADAAMIDQVLLNLVCNSRDAMPSGGEIRIRTAVEEVDACRAARSNCGKPGQFVVLEVSDTGTGIKSDDLPQVFDPFFTTKPAGQGTGLGLATVYSIVQQHQGFIELESQAGKGTTFRVFFPAVPAGSTPEAGPIPDSMKGGDETILVVEDQESMREYVCEMLSSMGYKVLEAASGPEALELWRQHRSHISMLFTDMVMPEGITGAELGRRLKEEDSGLKIIYSSGYSRDSIQARMKLDPEASWMQKPYLAADLIRIVRERLDAEPAESVATL